MSEYIVRREGEIIGARVSRRMTVPLQELEAGVEIDGLPYRRHLLGGGLVADNSFVADVIGIPYDVVVGPDTHVVSDRGIAGQQYIWGNLRNSNVISTFMDESGRKLRVEQKIQGVVGRLLEIERMKNTAVVSSSGEGLF